MAVADVRDELRCSVCLELYNEPVTLPCGHSFCRPCIESFLAEQGVGNSCPDCRAPLPPGPPLQRSIALCNIVQHFRSVRRPEVTGILCSYCLHAPISAVRSCLHCEASLCDDHLIAHSKSPQHVLSDPGTAASLESKKCPTHKETYRYLCTADGICICVTCRLDGEHQGHPVEPLGEVAERKKAMLRHALAMLTPERKEAEQRLHRLRVYSRMSTDLPDSLTNLIKKLEEQLDDLSRRIGRIKELCNATDPLTVLCDQESLAEEEKDGVEDLYGGLISAYALRSDVTLDLETAANNVRLSPDLQTLTWSPAYQARPETPARFQYNQVLSTRSFAFGQHSWQVETSQSGDWRIGVACHSIARKGDKSYLGDNNKSWCLRKLYSDQYSVMHDGKVITMPHHFLCHIFKVCLDCEAGELSFYELADPIRHLHTFTTTITEPLHAAFGIGYWLASEECWLTVGQQAT